MSRSKMARRRRKRRNMVRKEKAFQRMEGIVKKRNPMVMIVSKMRNHVIPNKKKKAKKFDYRKATYDSPYGGFSFFCFC